MTTTPADIEADILRRRVACLDEQYDNLLDDHDRIAKAGEAERDAHRATLELLKAAELEQLEAIALAHRERVAALPKALADTVKRVKAAMVKALTPAGAA